MKRTAHVPVHVFGQDTPTKAPGTPLLFWLALAGCTLVPVGYAAFLLFLMFER